MHGDRGRKGTAGVGKLRARPQLLGFPWVSLEASSGGEVEVQRDTVGFRHGTVT